MFSNFELLINILQSWVLTFLVINIFFLTYLWTKKISVIDLYWGPLHFIQLIFCFVVNQKLPQGPMLIYCSLVFLWAFRLGIYLYIRSINKPDDPRYLNLAKHWSGNIQINVLGRIFYAQFLILLITSFNLSVSAFTDERLSLGIVSRIGIGIALFGFLYESIADLQLLKFKKQNNKTKKVMNDGLWKYSRHPNYFGEILFWWGMWAVTIGCPYWYIGVISPITITYLLTRFSGVPMLEKRHSSNPEYLEYIRSTNTLIPGPSNKAKK